MLGTLAAIFRTQYDRPFWRSLAWTTPELPFYSVLTAGVGLAIGILLLGTLIRIPQTRNPLTDLLKDPTSLILIAIFGSIVAPVCEELVFRGFLQPLLVRSLGMAAGILATALPFGLLHFQEYGNSWRHVLLISISGVAFGCMRSISPALPRLLPVCTRPTMPSSSCCWSWRRTFRSIREAAERGPQYKRVPGARHCRNDQPDCDEPRASCDDSGRRMALQPRRPDPAAATHGDRDQPRWLPRLCPG